MLGARLQPDEPKGQLIYCYVGPTSSLESVKMRASSLLKSSLRAIKVSWEQGRLLP